MMFSMTAVHPSSGIVDATDRFRPDRSDHWDALGRYKLHGASFVVALSLLAEDPNLRIDGLK